MGLFKKSPKKNAAEIKASVENIAEQVASAVENVTEKVTAAVEAAIDEIKTDAPAEAAEEVVKAAEPAEVEEVSDDAAEEAAAAAAVVAAEVAASEEAPAEEPAAEPAEEDAFDEEACFANLHIIDHPLVQHKLTIMRDKDTGAKDFRELLDEIALLVGYEVTRELPLCDVEVETPIQKTTGKAIAGKKLAIVPILRAGLGMVDGLQRLVPASKVGHIGLYRHPETHQPVGYYCKVPDDIESRLVIITDPMLATGGSAIEAIRMLKEKGCTDIKMMCLVAAPEGVKALYKAHPDVPVFTAALDEYLNENAYIVPGLGDAGDRIFGTY